MDYGSRTRESLRAPYYQPSSSSAAAAASNGYFTDQAMRAGIGGGGVCGRFDPPMDLQNERIRLEIRAREGTQSRIVEENIRRELEFDRVMAARRHEAERFYLPQPQPQPQPHHEPRLGERIWPAPLPRYPEVVMYDRFPAPRDVRVVERYELERVPRYPQAGAVDRFQPPARDPRPVFRKKQQLARPLEMRRASGSKLSGTKRKAVATAGVSEYSRPEKWCCKVCKVEASSEKGLKEHYQGKKHKAALEESRGGGGGDKELTGKKTLGDKEVTDKKTLGDKELTGKKPLASSKPAQRKVEPVNETKKSTTQQKQSFDTLEGKPRFWCETCKLKCTSQTMLESHLNGKRHKAALDELAGGGIGSAKTADTPAKLDSEKMKLLLELESLKDPQKDEKTEEDEKMKVPVELEAEKTEAPSEMEAKNIEAPSEMEVEKDEKADKKTLGDRELTGKNPLASSKPVQRKVDPVNKIKKSTTQQKQKQKQSVDTSKGKPLFWCETCKLKCNSQTMLESHLNGKRHKAALDELAGGGIGSAKTADTPTKPDSEKMEVPLELESIKDEKTDVPPKLYPQKNEKTKEDEKMEAPAELESEKTKAPSEMGSEKAENIEAPSEIEVEKADKKTLGDKELTGKKPLASSKPVQQKVEPVNETKKSTIQQKQKQSVDTSEGKPLFWCETCKLKCNSQTMLESHLNGKRHNATLNELAGGGIGSAKTADTPTKLESEKMEVPLELEYVKDEKTDVPPKLYPQKDEKTEEDEKIEAPAELEAEKTEAPSSEMEVEMAENIEAPSEMEVEKTENTDAPSEIEAEGNGKPAAAVETEVPAKLEPEKSVKPAAGKANRRPARKRAKRTTVGAESVKKSAAAEEA